ncbi:MAG: hypothetical protein WDO68_22930 [Gammaproteobacteria bacterium]
MQAKRAREILDSLLHGVDPIKDRDLSVDSVLQDPDVLRALLAAIEALNDSVARASRRSQLPRNIGRTWTPKEHKELLEEFHANKPLDEIAASHGRALRAIEARLQNAGLITAAQRKTEDRFSSQESPKQLADSIDHADVGVTDQGGEPSSK